MSLDVTHVDHVTVLITDVARSRRFYTEVLGLREIGRPKTFTFMAVWYDLGPQQLHLLLKDQADPASARHFALAVKNIQAARAHFARLAIPMQETTVIPGCDRFFVFDPDQNRIEIIQWLVPYDPVASGYPLGE